MTAALMVLLHPSVLGAEPQEVGTYVLEREERARWVHEGQHLAFVPFQSADLVLHLRGMINTTGAEYRSLRLVERGQIHRLILDLRNRIREIDVAQPPVQFMPGLTELERLRSRWTRLRGPGATLSLPVARLWEVPFPVAGVPLEPGVMWTDTLDFKADAEGLRERLEGVWTHRVVGDTVVNTRRLPLVVTEAEVRYTARELTPDRAVNSVMEVLRDISGRIVGRAAVDTVLGVRAVGRDSADLHGTATLSMAGTAPLVTGIRLDRLRTWTLVDSMVWEARQEARREERRQRSTGMLLLPPTPLEERLRGGGVDLVDSLCGVWAETEDPDERSAIGHLLRRADAAGSGGQRPEDRLQDMRLAAGDTAGYVAEALSSHGRRAVYTPELIQWLRDPGSLWRLGILPQDTYRTLGDAMLASTPLLEPDTAKWGCRPDACKAVMTLVDAPVEQRLRDAALVGVFARDPARWFARVEARAAEGSLIARKAERLGRGVGATSPGATRAREAGVPGPEASWREWLDWMGGRVRFEGSHRDALRIYTARTGRDPVQELLHTWPMEPDSARLVLGTLLRGAGALEDPTPADLTRWLVDGTEADKEFAERQLSGLLRRHGTEPGHEVSAPLIQALLDAVAADGKTPWPWLRNGDGAVGRVASGLQSSGGVPVFVMDENLPKSAAWVVPPTLTLISREEWEARPLREGGVIITLQPSRIWGDFAVVSLNWTVLSRRAENEAPSGFAGGDELILMQTEGSWVVVYGMSWVT